MLLDQEVKKQEQPKGKKIVLFLLILSIILLIIIMAIMATLPKNQTKALTLSVNGSNVNITDDLLVTDDNGNYYISIQRIAKSIGYDYLTGEYKEYSEDSTNSKAYLQNEKQIIQFEVDTNKIYKTEPNSDLDYEEYELTNNIIKIDNLLYISLDDINIGLGVIYSYSQNNNQILLSTIDKTTQDYKTSLATSTLAPLTTVKAAIFPPICK